MDVPRHLRPRGSHHLQRACRPATTHHVTLLQASWVCARLRRLTFRGDTVNGSWRMGDRVMLGVGDNKRRYYTVCGVDWARRTFDVLAVAHDHGPGGRWTGIVQPGDSIDVFGPKPDLDVETRGARRVVLLGDETTLGLYEAVRRSNSSVSVCGAVEHCKNVPVNRGQLRVLSELDCLQRADSCPGLRLQQWLHSQVSLESDTVYFVNGHGAAVRALRLLLIRRGVRGRAIRSRAYWGR